MGAAKLAIIAIALLLSSLAAALLLYFRFDMAVRLSDLMPDQQAVALSMVPSALMFVLSLILCIWCHKQFKASDAAGISGFLFLLCCASSLAQLFMVISLAITTQDVSSSIADTREMGTGDASLERPGVVRFVGTIGDGALDQVLALETPDTKLRVLIIDSTGGFSDDALAIARYIESNEVAVVVGEQCLSSCTMIAAASNQTYAHADSVFGYHSAYFSSPKKSEIYSYGLQESKNEVWTYLASRGVLAEVIEKAKLHGPDSTLDFTAQEMLEKGLIKGILADGQWVPPGF
jgi:ATP-dependent protease ClpP protease subunit